MGKAEDNAGSGGIAGAKLSPNQPNYPDILAYEEAEKLFFD
jgi:hypothetical protein